MTEQEAQEQLSSTVPRETFDLLTLLAEHVARENERQNLISRSSGQHIWSRHIFDSAQLIRFAPAPDSGWIDLGTGAGFPGLVIALLHEGHITLVEERRLRCEFLASCIEMLGLGSRTTLICDRVQRMDKAHYDVISARAFAPLPTIFQLGEGFSTVKTRWILPKGRKASEELEAAATSWQGDFRLEQSLTDPDAMILVAEGVHRLKGKCRV
jgi:16S rRNA (guanine527-N7)-methyltransferase